MKRIISELQEMYDEFAAKTGGKKYETTRFESGKTYEHNGEQYKMLKRTKCYATLESSTGEVVRKAIRVSVDGIEQINMAEWPTLVYLWPTNEVKTESTKEETRMMKTGRLTKVEIDISDRPEW